MNIHIDINFFYPGDVCVFRRILQVWKRTYCSILIEPPLTSIHPCTHLHKYPHTHRCMHVQMYWFSIIYLIKFCFIICFLSFLLFVFSLVSGAEYLISFQSFIFTGENVCVMNFLLTTKCIPQVLTYCYLTAFCSFSLYFPVPNKSCPAEGF